MLFGKGYDLVIAGAGPAGLAAATALAEAGYRVLVAEAGQVRRPSKTWLTFGGIVEKYRLDAAVRSSCDHGHLRYYTGDNLKIALPEPICILDEVRLLEMLHARLCLAGGELVEEAVVLDYEHDPVARWKIWVSTSKGRVSCSILVDATGGGLMNATIYGEQCACYITYARIYEDCTPHLPMDEILLLHKGYPHPAAGQWSAPIGSSAYLLGEFDFWTSVKPKDLDAKKVKVRLRQRLNYYTWKAQNFVTVPRSAQFREFFGLVPLRATPLAPTDNFIPIGDSAGQARPFFGVSVDQLFEQQGDLLRAVNGAFEKGDFSTATLGMFRPQNQAKDKMNFFLGLAIWELLNNSPDRVAGRLCTSLRKLDETVKYNLLRTRLAERELRRIVALLHKEKFFRYTLRQGEVNLLKGSALAAAKSLYWAMHCH